MVFSDKGVISTCGESYPYTCVRAVGLIGLGLKFLKTSEASQSETREFKRAPYNEHSIDLAFELQKHTSLTDIPSTT